MNATGTIPVTVSEEAAARISELGFQAELEQMVQRILAFPNLHGIRVELAPPYDLGDEPFIVLWATRTPTAYDIDDEDDRLFRQWRSRTFPPNVLQHFCSLSEYLTP